MDRTVLEFLVQLFYNQRVRYLPVRQSSQSLALKNEINSTNAKMNVGFILKERLVSGKHLIQVHLEIVSRSVENMAQFPLVDKVYYLVSWRMAA